MFECDSIYHILNRRNAQKQTPLYVAAKHGHLDVIQFLLKKGANPKFLSYVSSAEPESLLEVSIRWSHVQIVVFLLEEVEWTKEEVKLAYRHVMEEESNSTLKRMLEEYSKKKFGKLYTFFSLRRCCTLCCCCTPQLLNESIY
jgi:hypothetical protein